MKIKYGLQPKLVTSLARLSLMGKWRELSAGLKLLNPFVTRHSIGAYWKFLFQVISFKLPESSESIPQLMDCLQSVYVKSHNEIVYSFILLLLSKNHYDLGCNLLMLYHLTSSSADNVISLQISALNSNIQFVKWKQACLTDVEQRGAEASDEFYTRQMAERCISQMLMLIKALDIADIQIGHLTQIYLFYDKREDLHEILERYARDHADYLNAQRYLFEFEVNSLDRFPMETFERIGRLSPADSLLLRYVHRARDVIMSLDCSFEFLDYRQWKQSVECWSCLLQLLIDADRTESVRECIRDNWNMRKDFWPQYHFYSSSRGRRRRRGGAEEDEDEEEDWTPKRIDLVKLNVACVLLGPTSSYVVRKLEEFGMKARKQQSYFAIHEWLAEQDSFLHS